MTGEEIINALAATRLDLRRLFSSEYTNEEDELEEGEEPQQPIKWEGAPGGGRSIELLLVGPAVEVSQKGGYEEGTHWESVLYFSAHDIYIKFTGYYSSYEGIEFDDMFQAAKEVKPHDKTITVYE